MLSGCEGASDVEFAPRASSQPEGLVQGRVDEDGTVHIAMVLAPKTPGGEAPDLSELRGVDLFNRSVIPSANQADTQTKARAHTDRRIGFGGNLNFSAVRRTLDQYALVPFFGDEELGNGIVNDENQTLDDVVCYASSRYIAYDHYVDFDELPNGRQKITYRHDDLEGSAEVYKESGFIWAKINDEPPTIVRSLNGQDPRVANVAFILPLNSALTQRGLSDELLKETVGVWTVEGDPQFSDRGFDSDVLMWGHEGAGATPFSFNLKALFIENVEAEYEDDDVDPVTGESFTGGATFTADLRFIEGQPEGQPTTTSQRFEALHERTAYKAQIFEDGGEVVRTLWGHAPVPGEGATKVTIPWNGEGNFGNRLPGNTVYGIAISAMLDDVERPAEQANGYIFTLTPAVGPEGVSAAFLGDEELTIEPAGYYPYTDEEINNYEETEDGELEWLGRDEFGDPLGPDHDGDGESDFEPGDGPPEVEFSADLFKPGYKTNWTLRVFKGPEDDRVEITESYYGNNPIDELTPPWTGEGDLFETWVPPGNLGDEEITLQLSVERCRAKPDIQILAQFRGTPDPSATPPPEGCPVEVCEVALDRVTLSVNSVKFGGTTAATRDDKTGPYMVYDYIGREAPNDVAQWNSVGDEMVPVVMKKGGTVYAKASFSGVVLAGRVTGVKVRALVNSPSGIQIVEDDSVDYDLTPLGLLGTTTVGIKLPDKISRESVPITWEFELEFADGSKATKEENTPENGGHMLYTVFGAQPEATLNTALRPEQAFIWYHPEKFRNDDSLVSGPVAKNEVPTRSPLDLAVHWASKGPVAGSTSSDEMHKALERVSTEIYDNGGWIYTFASGFTRLEAKTGVPKSYRFRSALASPLLECPDGSALLKILGNYLGIPCRLRKFEHTPTTPNWSGNREPRDLYSTYFRPMGIAADFSPLGIKNPFDGTTHVVPPFGLNTEKKGALLGVGHTSVKIPLAGTDPNNGKDYRYQKLDDDRHPSEWFQVAWRYHQVTEIGGKVIDCVPRFASNHPTQNAAMNPDGYLNQLNMNSLLEFAESHDKRSDTPSTWRSLFRTEYLLGWRHEQPNPNLPSVFVNARKSAQSELRLSGVPNVLLDTDPYLRKLLWGYTDDSFKSRTHFNQVRLPDQLFSSVRILNE